ncbi:ATP-binding protein [Vibrio splendidus]
MMKIKKLESKPFELSARVTMQLGRESISSSTVAISELIKNSYDADAEVISINFFLNSKGVSTLVIEDNGLGMDYATLTNNWLKIGTSNKVYNAYSPVKKRIRAGAKGLGRLGVDRLCKKLQLFTKTADMKAPLLLEVDWKKYEGVDVGLSEIEHDIYEVDGEVSDNFGKSNLDENTQGTRLVLHDLTDNWSESFVEVLVNELRLLVSPFKSMNDFKIKLNIERDGKSQNIEISSEHILDAARWHVKGMVDTDGNVGVEYHNKISNETIKLEPIPWHNWIKGAGDKASFGPVSFEFYYMSQGSEDLKRVNLKAKNFREFMRLNQGVRLYRDFFRVRPYGEPTGKGDWLDLGFRKASSPGGISQGGWKIGPNQIVGSVIISRNDNAILNDQANREGIVENEAFDQLRVFLIKTIESFETLAHKDAKQNTAVNLSEELAAWVERESKKYSEEYNQVLNNISNIKETKKSKKNKGKKGSKPKLPPEKLLEAELAKIANLAKRQEVIQEKVNNLIATYSEQISEMEYQKDTLSNLASIGILTISFGHEVRQHSSLAMSGISSVIKRLNRIPEPDDNIERCRRLSKHALEGAMYVDNFSKFALDNIKPDKRKRTKVNVLTVLNYISTMLKDTLDKMDIEFKIINELSIDNDFRVFSFEIDWESIIINMFTNAIWALETQTLTRVIEARVEDSVDEYVLTFADNGVGLESNSEENIFLPMVSGKRDKSGNSIGTGMGLAIVKTHVEEHMGGQIQASNCSSLGGAKFTIRIPKR